MALAFLQKSRIALQTMEDRHETPSEIRPPVLAFAPVLLLLTSYSCESAGDRSASLPMEAEGMMASLKPPTIEEALGLEPGTGRNSDPEAVARAGSTQDEEEPGELAEAPDDTEDFARQGVAPDEGERLLLARAADAQAPTVADPWPELPLGNGGDLLVRTPYVVTGKKDPYNYGNINIVEGGVLLFLDETIDFWAKSILVEKGGTLKVGSPGAPIGTRDMNNVVTFHL